MGGVGPGQRQRQILLSCLASLGPRQRRSPSRANSSWVPVGLAAPHTSARGGDEMSTFTCVGGVSARVACARARPRGVVFARSSSDKTRRASSPADGGHPPLASRRPRGYRFARRVARTWWCLPRLLRPPRRRRRRRPTPPRASTTRPVPSTTTRTPSARASSWIVRSALAPSSRASRAAAGPWCSSPRSPCSPRRPRC